MKAGVPDAPVVHAARARSPHEQAPDAGMRHGASARRLAPTKRENPH
ncbi:hypothetical protein AZ19_0682 [Bordetella bronchiseptica E012]|nr:hypothetical protein AZ18_0679 [Bordetella bronchiseptica D993]KDB96618.1 hypothetical protein AZ23_0684 [Bordetella bronchiseptica E010]KDC05789.1 hypothetical protein AZ19_0682 [Bordetella bronchiseptica E012]